MRSSLGLHLDVGRGKFAVLRRGQQCVPQTLSKKLGIVARAPGKVIVALVRALDHVTDTNV